MFRRQPITSPTYTLFPYTRLFRCTDAFMRAMSCRSKRRLSFVAQVGAAHDVAPALAFGLDEIGERLRPQADGFAGVVRQAFADRLRVQGGQGEIGRAHV